MAYKLDGSSPVMVPIKLETLQSIVQLLFVDLTEGEFETDYEQNKVQGLLDECNEAVEKTQFAIRQRKAHLVGIDPRLKAIADHYGFDAQTEKAIEEMAELIVAIKNIKKNDGNEADYFLNYIEELADVKIMIDQLIYLNDKDVPDDCDLLTAPEIEFKIKRTLQRIEFEEDDA